MIKQPTVYVNGLMQQAFTYPAGKSMFSWHAMAIATPHRTPGTSQSHFFIGVTILTSKQYPDELYCVQNRQPLPILSTHE
jgi:hypothetical protein